MAVCTESLPPCYTHGDKWDGLFPVQYLEKDAHSPLRAGSPGSEIKDIVLPQAGEPVVQKQVNSADKGTDLGERLRREGITTLIIAGLTTTHCVEATVRMAGNLGFLTYVVSDATATFDRQGPDGVLHPAQDVQAMTLANLHQEFATIVTAADVLQDLV